MAFPYRLLQIISGLPLATLLRKNMVRSPKPKKIVAFSVMEVEKAQWHVGHHAVTVELVEHWADEMEDNPWRRGHLVSYDEEVIKKLLALLDNFKPQSECDEKRPEKFKEKMDELSNKIKSKLNAFKGLNPEGSSPFFVSQLAADFAKEGLPKKIVKNSLSKE